MLHRVCRLLAAAILTTGIAAPNLTFAASITVRPGTYGDGCTLDFVFHGSDGNRYIATAGHCFLDNAQERTWPAGDGPTVTVAGTPIGTVAYAIWNQHALNPLPEAPSPSLPLPADIAVVRLSPSVASNPQVCHFGGPTAINTTSDPMPQVVNYYGGGQPFGSLGDATITPARTAVATGFDDPRQLALYGAIGPGDSGMPIIDSNGAAIGFLSHLGSPAGSSFAPVSRLEPNIERAQSALGITLTLQTAPLIPSATAFGNEMC